MLASASFVSINSDSRLAPIDNWMPTTSSRWTLAICGDEEVNISGSGSFDLRSITKFPWRTSSISGESKIGSTFSGSLDLAGSWQAC